MTIPVTTAVTCPIQRIHPAVVAHAAATSAVLHDGRCVLGVGTGEALNEHVTGERWPSAGERLDGPAGVGVQGGAGAPRRRCPA
ncbi:LLM class flavin-dependent oxidoreductase [Dactylosporangium sp. NPDC049140]|uniref:LLM class flavin-dependent oxidoreductase n=1 Tax=Dactylosporangium sp. NPDC049140 TaxID=3155647 RepID=UPI0033ED911C